MQSKLELNWTQRAQPQPSRALRPTRKISTPARHCSHTMQTRRAQIVTNFARHDSNSLTAGKRCQGLWPQIAKFLPEADFRGVVRVDGHPFQLYEETAVWSRRRFLLMRRAVERGRLRGRRHGQECRASECIRSEEHTSELQ